MRNSCLWLVLALAACGQEPPPPLVPVPAPPTQPPEPKSAPVSPDRMPEIGNYPPPPAGLTPVRAAVPEFQDKSGANVSLTAALQLEALTTASRRFRMIDQAQLKAILKEQGVEGTRDPIELAKPGRVRGVDYLFVGGITTFRLSLQRKPPGGTSVVIDTSRSMITAEIEVLVRLVNTTTGEILSTQVGEVKKEIKAADWGIRIVGLGGGSKDDVQVDSDSQARLLRAALDEALRKMLPDIDDKLSRPAAPLCPKCKTELPAGAKSCAKCGSATLEKCSCGADLQEYQKFCGRCGKKRG